MARRITGTPAVLTVLASIVALLLAFAVPALANHKDGHDKGSGHSESSDSNEVNESNDGDERDSSDPNEDDGDNAHPSGKDRSVENGGSGNQGNSESDPDDDGRGPDRSNDGADKPGGPGGVDEDDQDGNNGCGNDDDFEDDNEGWCGKQQKDDEVQSSNEKKDDKVCDADHNMKGVQPCEEDDDEVLGEVLTAPAKPEAKTANSVLGTRQSNERPAVAPAVVRGARERGGVLPFTGGDIVGFIFLALGLIAAGYLMLRSRRVTR